MRLSAIQQEINPGDLSQKISPRRRGLLEKINRSGGGLFIPTLSLKKPYMRSKGKNNRR
jgi:hypothetical protein